MTNREKVEEVLKNSKRMLTVGEIADICCKDEKYKIGGNTPDKTIGSILYVAYRDEDDNGGLKRINKPLRWGLNDQTYENENDNSDDDIDDINVISGVEEIKYEERELHKYLVSYMRSKDSKGSIYCKTIFHEESKKEKKGQNLWVHPDIVGVKFLTDTYREEKTNALKQNMGDTPFEFYSFEMKKSIDLSHLAEYFFQAVANSSWANYGYLVAENIDLTNKVLYEKMMHLSDKFGIGIIKLNIEHYAQSEVLFEAKNNATIDYDRIDEIMHINDAFKSFIENCNTYIRFNGRNNAFKKAIVEKEFDRFYEDEEEAYKKLHGSDT